jgi:hypothetical protein
MKTVSKRTAVVVGAAVIGFVALIRFHDSYEQKMNDSRTVMYLISQLRAPCSGTSAAATLPTEVKSENESGAPDLWVLKRNGIIQYEYRGPSRVLQGAWIKLKVADGVVGCDVDTSGVKTELVAGTWRGTTRIPRK